MPANRQATIASPATRAHEDYGAGALIVCDQLVRGYTESTEVQALQGLHLVVRPAS